MIPPPTSDETPGGSLSPSLKRIYAAVEIKAEPDATEMAFMARALVQATLPHSDPGEVPIWGRTNGRLTLTIKPDWDFIEKPTSRAVSYFTAPFPLVTVLDYDRGG